MKSEVEEEGRKRSTVNYFPKGNSRLNLERSGKKAEKLGRRFGRKSGRAGARARKPPSIVPRGSLRPSPSTPIPAGVIARQSDINILIK